jgi:hypothetical protein
LLDVSDNNKNKEWLRVAISPGALHAERRKGDHDEALILCAGERGSADVDAEPATLIAIDAHAKLRKYVLGTTPFNALAQSDDGRWAILYRNGNQAGRSLSNPNELVVVDLDAAPKADTAVTRKTPDGLAHTITNVLISPAFRIAGQSEDRQLLVLLSAAEVTMFDLGHLERRATIVSLDETRTVNPVQVVFDAPAATMYVRAQSSDNIFMFRFEPHDNTELGNDFRPSINPISGGSGPRDVALFGNDSPQHLLVVSANAQALVIDPSSSKTTTLKLTQGAEHILVFDGSSPSDANTRPRALLYSETGALTFIDPDELADQPSEHIEQLSAGTAIGGTIPLLDQHQAVLLHASGVTIVDLQKHTLTPIASSAPLSGALFDPDHERLWLPQSNQPWIGTLDLDTRSTDEVLLDVDVDQIVPLFAIHRLAAIHSSNIGYVTLLDLDEPGRTGAIALRGFFISGRLDRGE